MRGRPYETLDRWYGRDYCYIKVKSRDESVYILPLAKYEASATFDRAVV